MSAPRPVPAPPSPGNPAPSPRRGSVMVGVLVMVLVLAGLGASMLTATRGSRRKTRKVSLNLQRNLVLDAAVVHGFHVLRRQKVDLQNPLANLEITEGGGTVAKLPYRFRLLPDPQKMVVRISVRAGEEPRIQKSYAVAYLKIDDRGTRHEMTWSLRYFEPEDQKAELED